MVFHPYIIISFTDAVLEETPESTRLLMDEQADTEDDLHESVEFLYDEQEI